MQPWLESCLWWLESRGSDHMGKTRSMGQAGRQFFSFFSLFFLIH